MKPKTIVKLLVDVVMLVVLLQLNFGYATNTLYHEVMGFGILGLLAVHVGLNAKATKGLLARLFAGKLRGMQAFRAVADILLCVSVVTSAATGAFIAKDLFFGPGGTGVVLAHQIASYAGLGIVAAHLFTHAKYLAGVFGKLAKSGPAKTAGTALGATALSATLVVTGMNLGEGAFDSSVITSAAAGSLGRAEDSSSADASAGDSSSAGSSSARASKKPSNSEMSTQAPGTTKPGYSQGSDTGTDDSGTPTICTLCSKSCPIANLRCQKGINWATNNGYI